MSQENSTTTTTSASTIFSLSSLSPSIPTSPIPSSSSSFINEYDTSNCFSRLPSETVLNILSFVISYKITTLPIQTYSPHKQLAILSQVCRLFNKTADDVSLWRIAFEASFDSEAIIRAGIIDKNVIGGVSGYGAEGEGNQTTTTQIQTGENIWKELYKERQISINKIKNYTKTPPSPFVLPTDDFMEFNFDDENESDNENDVITNSGDSSTLDAIITNNGDSSTLDSIITNNGDSSTLDSIITNNGDGSTLDSTDKVDDNVHFNFNFNFVGNDRNEAQTDEIDRNDLDFTFEEDNEFRFQELEEVSANFSTEDTIKEHTTNDDSVKEDILKDDILKDGAVEENIKELLNLEYIVMDSTLDINVDDVVQDLDFVSEDLMKFDDPELDSLFDSDTVEIDNLVDTRNSNVVKNNTQHNEVLVKDTDNPAKEVDHVTRAQDLLNPEINGDLDETYLQDYDESSKFLDYEEEPFKSFDYEESFDKDKLQLQDYKESNLQVVFSAKSPNFEDDSTLKNAIDDDLSAKEVFQLQDFEIINNFDKTETTNLQNLNDNGNQAEIPLKDLPDYDEDEEITYLYNYEDDGLQNENVVIENDNNEPDYVWNFSNENVTNEKDANKEDERVKENLLDGKILSEKENNNNGLLNYEENVKENNLPNGNVINEEEGNDLPSYEVENNFPNGNVIVENEINDSLDYNTNDVETNENERMIRHDENDYLQDDIDEDNNVDEINEDGENDDDGNLKDIRRKIVRKNNDPELINILNIIWKICQENDGMNSEVLLEANVKEFVVNLIRSLDKKDTHVECLSIALQILSILASWHPELTIDLQHDDLLWTMIHYAMNYFDMFFPGLEDNIKLKQLILPAPAGSAIHIVFHTILFNSPNQSECIDYLLPQLIPDSNIFNNVYNKSNLKPGEGVIQPSNEDFSGKWCGYCASFQSSQSSPIKESSMDITSLEFSPSEPGKVYYLNLYVGHEPVRVTDKVVKSCSGRGTDQIGEFVIKNGIITEKGHVNFVQSYVGAHSWIYDGVLLPVGICGRWGTPSEWRGNFWIWKR